MTLNSATEKSRAYSDQQLNLRKRHPLAKYLTLVNEVESFLTRKRLNCILDVAYGKSAGETLDIFPSDSPGSPVLVFIHGGYFRALDKRQYSFLAAPYVEQGFTVVLVNYALAPTVSVDEIVSQNVKAFQWIYQHITHWNGDSANILLCGHSVGATLALHIALATQGTQEALSITGLVLLSGIYDLEPLQNSWLNSSLQLCDQEVEALSPLYRLSMFESSESSLQTLVVVGEKESDVFNTQSELMHEKLKTAEQQSSFMRLKGRNHYNVVRHLADQNTELAKSLISLIKK